MNFSKQKAIVPAGIFGRIIGWYAGENFNQEYIMQSPPLCVSPHDIFEVTCSSECYAVVELYDAKLILLEFNKV